MLDQNTLKKVSQEIYHRYPQVAGIKPEVKKQSASGKNGATYLLIYTNQGKKSSDVPITTYVRVVVTESGQILKQTTSR
jgi:hypothetical protein